MPPTRKAVLLRSVEKHQNIDTVTCPTRHPYSPKEKRPAIT